MCVMRHALCGCAPAPLALLARVARSYHPLRTLGRLIHAPLNTWFLRAIIVQGNTWVSTFDARRRRAREWTLLGSPVCRYLFKRWSPYV